MRFCKDCGTPLNLFSDREKDLCPACMHHNKRVESVLQTEEKMDSDDFQILRDTTISVEKNRITIRSKEGWELWSGSTDAPIEMNTLLARAKKIYQIRLRRQKN